VVAVRLPLYGNEWTPHDLKPLQQDTVLAVALADEVSDLIYPSGRGR
jgi:hypothetical protein